MSLQYVSITETDFSGGIDAASAENATPQGYVDDLVNGIPHFEGPLRKRPGYVTYAGGVPLRVTSIETLAGDQMRIYMDTGVSPALARNTPIIIAGRVSAAADSAIGDFSSTTVQYRYYNILDAETRRSVAPLTSSTIQLPVGESGLTSQAAIVQVTESTSLSNFSNTQVFVGSEIDTSFNVTADIVNGTSSTKYFFIQFLDTVTTSRPFYTASRSGSSWTISQAQHGFANLNIIARCYEGGGASAAVEVTPDSVSIAPSGDITITFSSSVSGFVVLVDCETENTAFGTVGPGATINVTLPDLVEPWIFADCYLDDGSGTRERVLPDSISVDATTMTGTVSITNSGLGSATFFVYWTPVVVTSSIVVDSVTSCTAGTTDSSPVLSVYGLLPEEVFLSSVGARAGWVNHIDNYRTAVEEKLVCGLGGRLFSAVEAANAPAGSLMPTWYPHLRGKTELLDQIVGPAFVTATSLRTRGYCLFPEANAGGAEGLALATQFAWNGTHMEVTIPATGLVTSGTPIETHWDWLTIRQAPYSQLVGSWRIQAVTYNANSIVLEVELTGVGLEVASTDFDISGVGAVVGVLSDKLRMQNTVPLLPGDVCETSIIPDTETVTVTDNRAVSGGETVIMLNGFETSQFYPLGVALPFRRDNACVISLRQSDDSVITPTAFNIVRGDMVSITGVDEPLRVQEISAEANVEGTVSIVPTVTPSIFTISGVDATAMRVGTCLPILGSPFNGVFEVTSIVDATTVLAEEQNRTTDTAILPGGSSTATLAGMYIQPDIAPATIRDSETNTYTVTVLARWLPIDTPTYDTVLGSRTHPSQFPASEYDEMPLVKSTMASDSLFLQSGLDFPVKYDGTDVYRAGILRWQPQIFMQTDTTSPYIVIQSVSVGVYSVPGGSSVGPGFIYTAPGTGNVFSVGDPVAVPYSGGTSYGNVQDIRTNQNIPGAFVTTPADLVTFSTSVTPTGPIYRTFQYRYYFRLNVFDANNQRIVSAMTGYDDTQIQLTSSSKIRFKLVGLPAFDAMDSTRFELEVYRTKSTGVAPFYRVASVDVTSAVAGDGYLLVDDITSDDALTVSNIDEITFKGSNLATALSPMPQAKYLTTYQNQMVVANLSTPQNLRLQLEIPTGSPAAVGGLRFLFRKDSDDSGTTTNMLDRIAFESKASASDTVTGITDASGYMDVAISGAIGVSSGDWLYLYRSSSTATANPRFGGWYQVYSITGGKIRITGNFPAGGAWNSGNDVNAICWASAPADVPVFIGTDYNFGDLAGNTSATTGIPYQVFLLARRLVSAINCVSRVTDTTIGGFESFVPWLMANGGGDYPSGTVEVQVPRYIDTTPELLLPASYSEATQLRIYGNDVKRAQNTTVGFLTQLFPSRIAASYDNFPEVFDNPFAADSNVSDSAMDINPADGQQITGIMPMFGVSSYVLSQRSSVLIVFKERSIYAVSPEAKKSGQNYLQKLETGGVGCTMPASISLGKGGIFFANETGIFRLNYQLQVEFVGYKLGRKWKQLTATDASNMEAAVGHNFVDEQQYKLSFSGVGTTEPNNVWVYNYRREDKLVPSNTSIVGADRLGGWCRYDNIPAVGWANQRNMEFFAGTLGRVFQTRNAGTAADYRDDAESVNMRITTRAMDFGDSGIRKMAKHILVSFRNQDVVVSGTQLSSAVNLYTSAGNFKSMQAFTQSINSEKSIDTLRFSLATGRFQYLTLRLLNSQIDEACEITGMTYRVAGLSDMRTTEAASKGRT